MYGVIRHTLPKYEMMKISESIELSCYGGGRITLLCGSIAQLGPGKLAAVNQN